MQGGWVSLADHLVRDIERRGPPDLLLATSTTNLAPLLGATRRRLGDPAVVLYMHENQLTYPLSPLDREDLTYSMINWTSMTVADLVLFNSQFHRRVWFDALPTFLGRFPDERQTHLVEPVAARSDVLAVGVDLARFDRVPRRLSERPLVLWNQRWEYDKGPAEFAAAVDAVAEVADFDVALAGERAGEPLAEFVDLGQRLGPRLVQEGPLPAAEYPAMLRAADVVVSTAHQEFFGIAVTEAVYAGAFPVLPDRLVYPERIPAEFHDACLWSTAAELEARLYWAVTHRDEARRLAARLRPTMREFAWERMAPVYDDRFEALLRSHRQ
jgi:glycosyltransferase involved in cell wall biosynthesis